MASRGAAAFLSCALFFLSTAYPGRCCPSISHMSCKGDGGGSRDRQRCGDHLLRCNHSSMEIRFRGGGPWFRVVGEVTNRDYNLLEIEDPILSPIFRNTHCDFLYGFPQPGPLFAPPQTLVASDFRDLHSYCNPSDYGLLFSKLIKGYKLGACTTYDLYFRSKQAQDLRDPVLRMACLPGHTDPYPMFIWNLSMNNSNNPNGTFSIISAGFSPYRRPLRFCFDCEMTGGQSDAGSAGQYSCGKKHGDIKRYLITGSSTAAGASILTGILLYLWCRNNKSKAPSLPTLLSHTPCSEPSSQIDPEEASINYPTHVFRHDELHEATNGFSPSNELDHGGQGAVYRGTLPDGRNVAIKRLYENSRCNRAELFLNEVAILSRLRHPNLVALYGCTSRHSRELLLVYEFIPNGTIADHLHGQRAAEGALAWPLRLRIAVETASALAYLHSMKPQTIHRDVKTSNILLDGDFHVKVGDFGLSRLFPEAASHVSTVPQGTPGYVDPQYHRCYQLTDKSDVYSFGVVLAELISSKQAVDVTRHQHEVNLSDVALCKIQNDALQELVDPKLGFETDWEVRKSIHLVAELAMRCLQWERDMRPAMEGVLEVLQGIADGLLKAEKGGEAEHMVRDGIGLQQNCETPSPDTVMGKWSSRKSTPYTSG